MTKKILLTSFDTWLPHHKSNSSDDLLIQIAKSNSLPHSLTFLRRLPVDISLASHRVLNHIEQLQPDGIICCGMAEKRQQLTVESNATFGGYSIKTSLNLERLVSGLSHTKISHDAGKFVCEGLYYHVLKELRDRSLNIPCIFVHVPLLTHDNSPKIIADFTLIIQRILP
ncbi:MAG TPA: peptidase C15 [Cyanobacteria bacterium UBA11372]|nr:peptidase C15 [Cyanobacteria bacterium UBA11372]HBE21579.1 peptidase C15 [Cyanobacteria bacterium UBA11367]